MAAHVPALEKERYRNYINGEWVESVSGEYGADINPANIDDVIGYYPLSTREEAQCTIDAAEKAFPSWRNVPAPGRAGPGDG